MVKQSGSCAGTDYTSWNKAGLLAVTDESLAKDAMGITEGHNLVEGNVVL